MSALEDVRKTIEAAIGNLTPAKAQELAKSFADPGTAKEQVSKMAGDMLEWSQRNRDRMREFVGREIATQMKSMGVATQSDLDALKKRVRELERRAGMTASGRRSVAKSPVPQGTAAKKSSAKKSTAKKSAARKGETASPTASTGS
ncbi:MAG: phasin family protein [Actinomycetota bacterium]